MRKRVITLSMVIVGVSLGASLFPIAWKMAKQGSDSWLNNNFTNGLIGAIISFTLSLGLAKYIVSVVKKIETALNKVNLIYLLFRSIGAIIGLTIDVIISIPMYNLQIPVVNSLLPILVMIILGCLGFRVGTTRIEEWRKVFTPRQKKANTEDTKGQISERRVEDNFHKYKILGTSVITGGRICDIAKTGFLEGVLLIPNFVLYELQYIADSGDSLKRVRGRRGLDILNALQREEGISVEIYDGDLEDISEVDSRLVKSAKLLDGVIVTNNYNLDKAPRFQNVPILSINVLTNVVKPVAIPGGTVDAMVVKTGAERQQGVAYLDDDTVVVVGDSQHCMDEQIEVVVTNALQTTAGCMAFAKPAHAGRGINGRKDNHPKNDKN